MLPSYHEGLPIVALEAMSYGLPVLVSAIAANMELVSEEDTFKPGDIVELASKIAAFIKSPSPSPLPQGERVLNERLRRLETEFNWDRIAEQTLEVYERVLGR